MPINKNIFKNSQIWGMLELEQDKYFQLIEPKEYEKYIDDSCSIGENLASKYKECELKNILEQNRIEVRYIQKTSKYECYRYKLYAQISCKVTGSIIEVYIQNIYKKAETARKYGIVISNDWMLQLHLAHELYHFIEFTQSAKTGEKLKKIQKKKWFRKSEIPLEATSEIAAHRFAECIMDSPVCAKVFDYLEILEEKIITEKEFQNKIVDADQKLQRRESNGKDKNGNHGNSSIRKL